MEDLSRLRLDCRPMWRLTMSALASPHATPQIPDYRPSYTVTLTARSFIPSPQRQCWHDGGGEGEQPEREAGWLKCQFNWNTEMSGWIMVGWSLECQESWASMEPLRMLPEFADGGRVWMTKHFCLQRHDGTHSSSTAVVLYATQVEKLHVRSKFECQG